jgi:hypothetical protein
MIYMYYIPSTIFHDLQPLRNGSSIQISLKSLILKSLDLWRCKLYVNKPDSTIRRFMFPVSKAPFWAAAVTDKLKKTINTRVEFGGSARMDFRPYLNISCASRARSEWKRIVNQSRSLRPAEEPLLTSKLK